MSVRVNEFQKYAARIADFVQDSDERSHHGWVAPFPFKLPHFYDPLNFEGDMTPRSVQVSNGKQSSVKFVHKLILERFPDLNQWNILYSKTLWNTENGKLLSVDFESSYCLNIGPHLDSFGSEEVILNTQLVC